jgi:RHS repeat-associated protein
MVEEITSTTNEAYHFHYDGNGNVTEITDHLGVSAATYRYDAFGNTLVATGTYAATNRYRFSTKPLDHEVTTAPLYYYGYRYLDPLTGRWPSRDPIEEAGGVNLYGFVYNMTPSLTDFLGASPLASPYVGSTLVGDNSNYDLGRNSEDGEDPQHTTRSDSQPCSERSHAGNVDFTFLVYAHPAADGALFVPLGALAANQAIKNVLNAAVNEHLEKVVPMGSLAKALASGSLMTTARVSVIGFYKCCVCDEFTSEVGWNDWVRESRTSDWIYPATEDGIQSAIQDGDELLLDAVKEAVGFCKKFQGS